LRTAHDREIIAYSKSSDRFHGYFPKKTNDGKTTGQKDRNSHTIALTSWLPLRDIHDVKIRGSVHIGQHSMGAPMTSFRGEQEVRHAKQSHHVVRHRRAGAFGGTIARVGIGAGIDRPD
jgi:hypothetical protein